MVKSWNAPWYFFIRPGLIFLHRYIWKRGFLDGTVGLIIGINAAISYFVAFAALWDMQRKKKMGMAEDSGLATAKEY